MIRRNQCEFEVLTGAVGEAVEVMQMPVVGRIVGFSKLKDVLGPKCFPARLVDWRFHKPPSPPPPSELLRSVKR